MSKDTDLTNLALNVLILLVIIGQGIARRWVHPRRRRRTRTKVSVPKGRDSARPLP